MSIRYYQDYWRYVDPSGRVYTLLEFQQYLDTHHPKKYDWDYSTQAGVERELTTTGGWTKVKNEPMVPPLEDVVGKFLVVSQHAEPRTYVREKGNDRWEVWNYKDLAHDWWSLARPDIEDEKHTYWGRSTWLIGHDGTLTFVGADYDSSD